MISNESKDSFIVAVTGASGALYAERFLNALVGHVPTIDVIFSQTAAKVVRYELADEPRPEISLIELLGRDRNKFENIRVHNAQDFFAPMASGSSSGKRMVVVPCSMGTMGRIANGVSSNLIERTADVVLKERGRLVICPRETPFNLIHLNNMQTLIQSGAHIVPAMPGFYQKPKSLNDIIDFMAGKLLEAFDLPHSLYPAWQSDKS